MHTIEKYITKMFKFEASHRLNLNYNSPCKSLHGHSYKVKLTIYGELNDSEMIIDFSELKQFQHYLDGIYDHSIILNNNDSDEFIKQIKRFTSRWTMIDGNPTAEKFAEIFCNYAYLKFKDKINNLNKIEVEVWETEKNSAGYKLEVR